MGSFPSPCKNEGNSSCLEIWCLVFQSLNSWKPRVLLEMCLKIPGFFLQLCKVSWKACVWIFLENPFFSQLSKSCERLVFGDFVENRWFFTTLQSLVKSSCLQIFLKLSLVFRSWAMLSLVKGSCLDILAYFVEKENLVKNSCLEILMKIAGFSQLCEVSWNARVWRFLEWSLVFRSYVNNVKSRERLVFGDFIEMISGLSKLCKVLWNARVWRFSWNVLWSFAAM